MKDLEVKNGKLGTKEMLEEGFFKEFKNKGGKVSKPTSRPSKTSSSNSSPSSDNVNTESVLLEAYEVRDGLIDSFSEVKLGSSLAENMKEAINKVGDIIVQMGGEAEMFDPLAHVSGLQAPTIKKYASRVIENTVDSYSIGTIEDAKIDGNSILMTFTGASDKTSYKAFGTITANTRWLGTEAVDYIYTPGAGKMSVKVVGDDGRWIDKSDNYSISWELLENEIPETLVVAEKNDESKEEESSLSQNNLDDDIKTDFPIEEK